MCQLSEGGRGRDGMEGDALVLRTLRSSIWATSWGGRDSELEGAAQMRLLERAARRRVVNCMVRAGWSLRLEWFFGGKRGKIGSGQVRKL